MDRVVSCWGCNFVVEVVVNKEVVCAGGEFEHVDVKVTLNGY